MRRILGNVQQASVPSHHTRGDDRLLAGRIYMQEEIHMPAVGGAAGAHCMPAEPSSRGTPAQGERLTLGLRSSRASHHSTLGTGSSSMAGFRLSCGRCPSGIALTSPTTLSALAGLASSSPNSACAV